jgi:hypothetical protein
MSRASEGKCRLGGYRGNELIDRAADERIEALVEEGLRVVGLLCVEQIASINRLSEPASGLTPEPSAFKLSVISPQFKSSIGDTCK